jgi:hypothetical protein
VQHSLRPLAPAWAVLNSQHLIVLASMIPQGQKNITTLKWNTEQLFTAATKHLTPAVVKFINLETKWSLGSINHNKITWKLQTRFGWVCTWGIMNKCNIPKLCLHCWGKLNSKLYHLIYKLNCLKRQLNQFVIWKWNFWIWLRFCFRKKSSTEV